MAKVSINRKRLKERMRESIYDSMTLQKLRTICGDAPDAVIEIDSYYAEKEVTLCWTHVESDAEMAERISQEEAMVKQEAEQRSLREQKRQDRILRNQQTQDEKERAEYERLRAKFETTHKD